MPDPCRSRRFLPFVAAALLCATPAAGCIGDEGAGADNAVEAQERNEVRLGGVAYRVSMFRQLNPRIEPDDAYYDGPMPDKGAGVYAAFVRACNPEPPVESPSTRIFLEDAFGEQFHPVEQPDNKFAYDPRPLKPGECLPSESAASQAEGAVLAFVVPFADTAERPMILVIRGSGHAERRIELDL